MLQKHTANVLNKVFVREFYRMNSGFFLLTATLAFGFMSQAEHVALAQFFVSSPAALLIPVCIWIAYALKILAFNIRQLILGGDLDEWLGCTPTCLDFDKTAIELEVL